MDSKTQRAARLAAELRANLKKRKAQARGGSDAAPSPPSPPPMIPADDR